MDFGVFRKVPSQNTYRFRVKEKGGQYISNGLLMIVGASTCEVGVVYVGIKSHLPTGLVNLCCLIDRPDGLGVFDGLMDLIDKPSTRE